MQYYLNDKKLNKIEKQKAEKDGWKFSIQFMDNYKLKTRVNPFQFVDSEVLTVDSLSTSSCDSLVSRFKNGIYTS